ncbi:MAG: acetamidase/formamidase family protein [Gemmatimonadota bacterium]
MAHHTFAPSFYHNTLGWHEPVLTVEPGDAISTTTVDARGYDAAGQQVAERGNPQTGPFAVRGAEPGDTLVVTLDALRPSRRRGWTSRRIAANVLEPGHASSFAQLEGTAEWEVDAAAGTARLIDPAGPLASVDLHLDPMVGCFGVAPSGRQAIATSTSSTHGGNMDYRGFRQGVKVYFPVFAPGGLFSIGDGHAVQGDGEIIGTGIEISFDVTFTLDLVKGRTIGWPRAESPDYYMTVGNARPLDQCVQHSTSEMVRWLIGDLGLDAQSVHLMMGQCVEYDLGNIFDPAYTMVCKVPRSMVSRLAG